MADIWKTILFKICPTPLDVGTDIWNGVNFIANGSPIWGAMCLGLTMVPGIVHGVRVFVEKRTWSYFLICVIFCLFGWILLPLYTVIGFCKTLCQPAPKPGDPITPDEVSSHDCKFLEVNTESMGQVVLNVSILMISGLQEKKFLFPGDLQLLSLSISFIMIIKSAGEQHFFRRTPFYPPSFLKSFLVSIVLCPDIIFRVLALPLVCIYLRWLSVAPIVAILCLNYYGAAKWVTTRDARLSTAAMSVISPSVYIDTNSIKVKLASPTIQRDYYSWNRKTFAGVLFPYLILVAILVNTTFVEEFGPLCQILSLPACSPLTITVDQFNYILLPLIILSGLFTLVHQFLSNTTFLARPMRYDEQIAMDGNGYTITRSAKNKLPSSTQKRWFGLDCLVSCAAGDNHVDC